MNAEDRVRSEMGWDGILKIEWSEEVCYEEGEGRRRSELLNRW